MSQNSDLGLTSILATSLDHNELFQTIEPLIDYVDADFSENANLVTGNDDLIGGQSTYMVQKTEDNFVQYDAPAQPPQQQIPRVLSNDEYAGPLNFEVNLPPPGGKNPWVFSPVLKKIFIGMNVAFPVDFKWDLTTKEALFVRATPVFANPQFSQDLVVRCVNHTQKTDINNTGYLPHVWDHVIRCQNSGAFYDGDKERGIHLSVLVPLAIPQIGTESVREMYTFMCKNSCPSGMNRKPLEVLFTLENQAGVILGRRVLQVRVCSCPKRDKEKEEKEATKKDDPPVKKRRVERAEKKISSPTNENAVDSKEYFLQLKIVGRKNYVQALQFCSDRMAGEIVKQGPFAEAPFRRCLTDIDQLLRNVPE